VSGTYSIFLRRNATGEIVEGTLHERVDGTYARRVDDAWLTFLAAAEASAKAQGQPFVALEHAHWEWEAKVAESARLLSCPTLAIECDGEPQGLMLVKTDGHFAALPSEKGKPLLYVTYLASAPWNLARVVGSPRFSGVGTVRMAAAVQMSIEAEFKGRLGLHSLPQSESFYECHGLVSLGVDPRKENLKYYELCPDAAANILARRKP
jgi:hypothetical protein